MEFAAQKKEIEQSVTLLAAVQNPHATVTSLYKKRRVQTDTNHRRRTKQQITFALTSVVNLESSRNLTRVFGMWGEAVVSGVNTRENGENTQHQFKRPELF